MVYFLSHLEDINPNQPDHLPLKIACEKGHTEVYLTKFIYLHINRYFGLYFHIVK